MKLSKEQATRLTNEMLDMLEDARLCGREGLETAEIHIKLDSEISLAQIARLLRKSGRASKRKVYVQNVWSLTPDELLTRFSDGSQLYRKKAEARERLKRYSGSRGPVLRSSRVPRRVCEGRAAATVAMDCESTTG
jgi:hypothetical protein